jgi:hypothetical protein
LIIGGAECGWEYAVSNGWIRAFKMMVEKGMEIEMPILKLYSMSVYQRVEHSNGILKKKESKLTL